MIYYFAYRLGSSEAIPAVYSRLDEMDVWLPRSNPSLVCLVRRFLLWNFSFIYPTIHQFL